MKTPVTLAPTTLKIVSPLVFSLAALVSSNSAFAQLSDAQTSEETDQIQDVLEAQPVTAMSRREDMNDSVTSDWSGSAGFGAVATSGNSDTQNVAGSISLSKRDDIWRHNAFGSLYKAENDNVESANRFDLGYKLDRDISQDLYAFGRLRFDSDDFGNIDGRYSAIVGMGKTFIDTGKVLFNGEAGIGGHDTKYDVAVDGSTSADGAVFYVGFGYSNLISENLTFNSVLNIEQADSNRYTVWDNNLSFRVSDRLSLNLGLLSRDNSDVVGAGGSKSDTATRWSINYGI